MVYRIGGLFGPNERATIPRAIQCIEAGILNWAHSLNEELKIDFLHIDNAVQAHIKVSKVIIII